MKGKDAYVIAFRVLGIFFVYGAITSISRAISAFLYMEQLQPWAVFWAATPAVFLFLGAYLSLSFAPQLALWISGEEGEREITSSATAEDIARIAIFSIGLAFVVAGISGLAQEAVRSSAHPWGPDLAGYVYSGARVILGLALVGHRKLATWGRNLWAFLSSTRGE